MGIIHFRVDDRLIHGIVAGYWVNHLQATRIMIIDDESSQNEIVRTSLRMACPKSVNLSVLDTEKAIKNIQAGNYETQRVFVIVKSPDVLLKLSDAGIPVPEIYLGNITYTEGRLKVAKTVSLNQAEIETCESFIKRGTRLISQLIPKDNAEDFGVLLHNAKSRK